MEMQISEKNLIDARSFREIWETLSPIQRQDLSARLQRGAFKVSRQTVSNWANGHTVPNISSIRYGAARVIGKYLGVTVYPHTLFPIK